MTSQTSKEGHQTVTARNAVHVRQAVSSQHLGSQATRQRRLRFSKTLQWKLRIDGMIFIKVQKKKKRLYRWTKETHLKLADVTKRL